MGFVAGREWILAATEVTYRTMQDAMCVPNACIEAGCIAVGVAEQFGYLCQPVAVAVRVTSASGKEVTVLPGPESRRADGFGGHVVVWYPGADVVVDLTARQFHAPARGLHVPDPLLMDAPRSALTAGFEVRAPRGTTVAYQELVGDVSWRSLPAWRDSSAMTIAVAARRLRNEMERAGSGRGRHG